MTVPQPTRGGSFIRCPECRKPWKYCEFARYSRHYIRAHTTLRRYAQQARQPVTVTMTGPDAMRSAHIALGPGSPIVPPPSPAQYRNETVIRLVNERLRARQRR